MLPGLLFFLTRPCLRLCPAPRSTHDMLDGLRQGLVSTTLSHRCAISERAGLPLRTLGTTDLAQRTQTFVRSSRRASRDRTWSDPHIQTAHRSPPLVLADLSTSVWPAGGRPWRTHDRVRTPRPPRTPREIVTRSARRRRHTTSVEATK